MQLVNEASALCEKYDCVEEGGITTAKYHGMLSKRDVSPMRNFLKNGQSEKKRLYAETIKRRFYHERKYLIKKRAHVALAAVVTVERTAQSLCRFPTSAFEITFLISIYPQLSILARVNPCICDSNGVFEGPIKMLFG
ncbi:hypothetical protein POVWA2_012460 [Plasmodium ovale wallikeri]|uniref:Uncharacterized protein n=1 Tax=Plasmodium ovale wallikeri TaxID=864142 RepID=A0A1A8YN42_PLAOA|nr:hypothetical protein POVWA2_012460 [Plasmodium ovale wallikeri]